MRVRLAQYVKKDVTGVETHGCLLVNRICTVTGERTPLNIAQQGTMGHITTAYDLPNDLTTFMVVGKMSSDDFYECLDDYYTGSVTLLNLWDATEADLSAIATYEIEVLAYYGRKLAEARKGGKTAIVFHTLHDFGLGRMLQSLMEIAGLPLETYVCRSHNEAMEWLGVEGAMIVDQMQKAPWLTKKSGLAECNWRGGEQL